MLVHRSTSGVDVGYILKYNFVCNYIVILVLCTEMIMNERVHTINMPILALHDMKCECVHAASSGKRQLVSACTAACTFARACEESDVTMHMHDSRDAMLLNKVQTKSSKSK